jgi:hypothetical protein
MSEEPEFFPDLLLIDEAQKIGDGSRGILLEQVIEECARRNPSLRTIFASPMASNPERLLETRRSTLSSASVASDIVTVNQNLLWASQVSGKPKIWNLELCRSQERRKLGSFQISHKPLPASKRLPLVAAALGKAGGNVIYVNGKADAEKAALLLRDVVAKPKNDSTGELRDLAELAQKTVHKKYCLAQTVPYGIAFHYGNIPQILRAEIERLFRCGGLDFLVCTSTLIEGVNLPAKSIFVRGPQRGKGKPMNDIDFWNLAGRAGRLGKEFQGNVVCVDPQEQSAWRNPPPTERRKYTIDRAVVQILRTRETDLLRYIEEGTPRSGFSKADDLESAFGFLVRELGEGVTLTSSPRLSEVSSESLAKLDSACRSAQLRVEIPSAILSRNPGVSSLAQQRLLEYFRSRNDIDSAVPADPADSDAVDNYVRVVGLISQYLSGDAQLLNFPRAILVVNWMRGYSIARLVESSWSYWRTRGKKLAFVIRQTLAEIDEFARFRFAKYSSCYVDILRLHLSQRGRVDLLQSIPRLNLWLEFGTSVETQLSLISLGLSRSTAIEISEIIARDDLSRGEALSWLRGIDPQQFGLSPIIEREILRVLGRNEAS